MDDMPEQEQLPRPLPVPRTPPPATKRPPASLRQQPRAISMRAPKPRPISEKLQLQISIEEQEPRHIQSLEAQGSEQKEEDAGPISPASPIVKRRSGSLKSSRQRPFGGKLKIDVDAAERVAPPIIGSPLGYYVSKKLPSTSYEDHPVSIFNAESHAGALSTTTPFLEYGMIISLVCDDRGGLVAAEGFALRDVKLEKLNYGAEAPMARLGLGGMEERRLFAEGGFRLVSCPFRDCLFEVVPKMTYDATIALRSLMDDTGQPSRKPSNEHTVDNLRFKSEAETRLNAMMYKKLKGTQVIYGQAIQLRHMKSGKYVSLDPSPISFRGSEYAPVFLDVGGPSSHFNVLPRFKLRSKGAPVQLTDQMILTGGTESQPFNLFVSNRKTTDGASTAIVGSSVHSSQWRPVYYDNMDGESFTINGEVGLPSRNDEGLRAGSCIRLLHLESSSWLGFCRTDTSDSFSGLVTLHYSDENEQEDGTRKALSPDSLWEVEHVSVYAGGQIKWREAITLRHLLTGQYLAVTHHQSPRAVTRSGAGTRLSSHVCAQAVAQENPQLFRFVPTAIADEESQIENGEVVLIQHQKTNTFIHSIDTHASTMADIRLSAKPLAHNSSSSKSGAGSGGASFTVVTLHGARDEDAFKVVRVPQTEVTDTLLLVSYHRALKQFLDQFRLSLLNDDPSSLQFGRESTVGVFRRTEDVLAELINFCLKAEEDSVDQLRCRQSLFRTYQYIELLVEMIKAPFQNYGGPFSIDEICSYNDDYMDSIRDTGDDNDELEMKGSPVRSRTGSLRAYRISEGGQGLVSPRRSMLSQDYSWRRKSTTGVTMSRLELHTAAMQSLNRIIPAINVLLLHISWANRANELYVVKVAMPVLMELLGNGFQTSLPLSYLLRENRNLVESITGCAGIIRNFFELIAARGKSIRYMQFLVALCTSRGKGIPKTQEAVCDLLFNPVNGYRDGVIIPIRPSKTGFDICLSSSSDINQDIEVMFNRSAKRRGTVPTTGTWMSLAKFYEEYYGKAKHRALGQYCYGLFRLYVSLCLDRNYVSIEYIQAAFPRENILKSVMDPCLSRSLRSVMMDLLRVAYVDCEPQKTMSCPNYTRIWTDIGASAAKALVGLPHTGYSPEDIAFFASLKEFCYYYLDQLQGAIAIDEIPENELTLAILRVSRKMAEFGMYSSEDDLSRFVLQLFDLLDERTDFVHESPGNNTEDRYNSPASLFAPALHLRRRTTPNNVQVPAVQQRKMPQISGASERRPGWGATAHMKNAVLFDGAGAMSSIRITKERDATRQYKTVDRNSRISSGIINTTATLEGPYRHLNKLLMYKSDVHTPGTVNVHEMNEVNRVVMEIKDEICAIFLLVDQVRIDFLISTLLASFQARHGGALSSSPTRYRDPDIIHTALYDDAIVRETVANAFTSHSRGLDLLPHGHDKMSPLAVYLFGSKSLECKLSLSRLGRRASTTIFMQMLMYEYPPLVSKALELLLQQYNQHDQFLKEMQNVQLLVSEETISIYNKLKGDVDELRRLAETTEVWMDLTSRSDFEKASSVCQLLHSLVSLIEHSKAETPVSTVEPRLGGARRQLQIQPPGKSTSEDESSEDNADSAADLLSTNSKCTQKQVWTTDGERKPVHRLSIDKPPPNRKLKTPTDRYVLNPAIGRVSQFSCSHEIVPLLSKSGVDGSSTTAAKSDDRTIGMEARRLLRNLKAAQFVLGMLIDGAHLYEGHFSDECCDVQPHSPGSPTTRSRTKLQKRQRDQIRGVFVKAITFLRAFCSGDSENQALVAPHATMIAGYIRELPIAQELLVAIYADNFPLYKSVPTELINIFVGRLIHDGPDPRYLFFLETLVLCDEQPIVDNQLLVLFQLVKSFEDAKVLQMFDDAGQTVALLGDLLSRHANLSKGAVGTNKAIHKAMTGLAGAPTVEDMTVHEPQVLRPAQVDNVTDTGKLLEYHVRLLHLFAACATGKNTRVQEICQQILPLFNVLDLLSHTDCTEGLQFALLRFLDQIFLTADDIETPGVNELLQIMTVLSQVCERRVVQYLSYVQVKDFNRQTTLSLRKNKSKAGKLMALSSQKPFESAPLYLIIFSIIPTLYSFIQQFSSFVDNSEEAQYCLVRFNSYVTLLLMVCATSKWQLPEDVVGNIEEFIYVIDKSVRPIMLQYQVSIHLSLEQAWSMSLKYQDRLNCSSLNCELEISDMLQWAVNKRDQEIKSDTSQSRGLVRDRAKESKAISLLGASPNDATDISPLSQAIRDSTTSSNMTDSAERTDTRSKAIASFKLDNLSTNKPVAWGDSVPKSQESKEPSPTGKVDGTLEAVDTENVGRLLHRLSPRRYYKGLRTGKGGLPYLSPKKETPVTPFFNMASERRTSRASISVDQTESMYFIVRQQQQFGELGQFLAWLHAHPKVNTAIRDELNQMVQGILNIEASMKEEYNSHLHAMNVWLSFDLVVAKLVEHVEALQDSTYLKTNLTLLNVFCRMIDAVEDAEERHNMQVKLNQLGVTRLVVQLISSRENDALFTSCIEVGVALLDGMNAEVQESFYGYWNEPDNERFFERIQDRIEKACKLIHSIDRASVNVLTTPSALDNFLDSPGGAGDLQKKRQSIFGIDLDKLAGDKKAAADKGAAKRLGEPITSIFRFLQLLCEGHYLNAQRALIAQPTATVSANLVESTTSFLLDTYLALTDMDMGLITQLFETITEYCQGPCVEAQETVANYKFISAVNALLTHTFVQHDTRAQSAVQQLRAAIVVTLLSLLEGRSDHVIHSQLVQELNFEALKMNLVEMYVHFLHKYGTYAGNVNCSEDSYLTMGFNIYILLQQLADQHLHQAWWIPESDTDELSGSLRLPPHPKMISASITDEEVSPDYKDAFQFFQANCAKVEVVWDHHRSPAQNNSGTPDATKTETVNGSDDSSTSGTGALIPFYFPIHPICFCLTNKSKKKLVWDVSRGADKLSDFYLRSDKLVDEMTHQSHLQHHMHVAWVARKSEEIKRVAFTLAVIINLVVLLFYRAAGVNSRPFAASQVTFVHTWGREVDPPKPSLWIDAMLSLAGTVQIILYSMALLCYMLNSAPLLIKKGWKRRHRKEQAKLSKRSAHSTQQRSTDNKERESFQDTEQLLRSLREREEEYNYLFLPPSIQKRSVPNQRDPVSPRFKTAGASVDAKTSKSSSAGVVRNGNRIRGQLKILGVSLYFLFRSPRVLYSLCQIFVSVLGSYVNKLYFAFLLLDVVDRYKELNNVLRSISRPAKALGVTTLLYLIVVYVFAVVGFFFFREDYTPKGELSPAQIEGRAPYTCQRLFQCFLVSLDQGLKSDGGLGSYLRQLPLGASAHTYGRLAFDVSYNILLVVLLLNLVFGVIIDTFASLRTDDQEKILDMQGRCFICSIDAYTFDRSTKRGFHDHISRDHNMWHYLYLFVHIRKKQITDYTGLELFLAMRMAKKDMSFFPTHRALSLIKRVDLEENHEVDMTTEEDRFHAPSTSFGGSRRHAMTPFSPSRATSLGSGATSSHRGSNQWRDRAQSKRTSSVSFQSVGSRSVYLETAIPGVQASDPVTTAKLERIESTINTLVNAQTGIKEAQQRAEDRYAELLATISNWRQPLGPFSTPTTPGLSTTGSPAVSRRPSARMQGSVTPRIFTFDSVADNVEGTENLRPREARQGSVTSSLSSTTSSASRALNSTTPRTLTIEIEKSAIHVEAEGVEGEGDGPSFLDEGQDWFAASPGRHGQVSSPVHASSLTYHLPSGDSEYSASPDLQTLAQGAPTYGTESPPHESSPQLSRKRSQVTPRVFNFEFVSDDEEEYKDGSPSPSSHKR
ncbi:Inositol 1 [Phytophthora citrophthora]|uniref:Inositol 1 n=1 Tax=Phytophthora citrophthora TaxID=4793 RepID=A0AAD9LIJ6_9STRA|nr:Inositol 1 [Phytophthora citrophthora]